MIVDALLPQSKPLCFVCHLVDVSGAMHFTEIHRLHTIPPRSPHQKAIPITAQHRVCPVLVQLATALSDPTYPVEVLEKLLELVGVELSLGEDTHVVMSPISTLSPDIVIVALGFLQLIVWQPHSRLGIRHPLLTALSIVTHESHAAERQLPTRKVNCRRSSSRHRDQFRAVTNVNGTIIFDCAGLSALSFAPSGFPSPVLF